MKISILFRFDKTVKNMFKNGFYEDISVGSFEKDITKIHTVGLSIGLAIGLLSSLGTELVLASSFSLAAFMGSMLIAAIVKELYGSIMFLQSRDIMMVIGGTSLALGSSLGLMVALISGFTKIAPSGILLGLMSAAFAIMGTFIFGTIVGFLTPVLIQKENDKYLVEMKKLYPDEYKDVEM